MANGQASSFNELEVLEKSEKISFGCPGIKARILKMVHSISVFLFRKDNNVTVFILFLFLLKKDNEEMGGKRIQLERNIYNIMYNRI